MSTSVLAIPNSGRLPIWTGLTTSGSTGTMLYLQNRTVQLHISTADNMNSINIRIHDSTLQKLTTYLFEFPTRHYGILCDELGPASFILPQLNDNVQLLNRGRTDHFPIRHLRFSEPETIGRDVYHGCPEFFNELGRHIQATEILYSHHHQSNIDVLIIKLTLAKSSDSYANDLLNGFPRFEFNTPMMFRSHFKLNERNHIFRNRMSSFVKVFTIANLSETSSIRKKLSELDHYKFELQLNDELTRKLPNNFRLIFNDQVLTKTAKNVLNQIFQLGLTYDQGVRASTAESQQIFDYLMEDDDPTIKILKEHLSLESIYEITTICCTRIIKTRTNDQYLVKFQLSC